MASKARCRRGILRHAKSFLGTPELLSTNKDFICSSMEYCSTLWAGSPPTRFSSAALWSTALPSGLAPLHHILLSLTPKKQRPSISLESLVMKLRVCLCHFTIDDRSVVTVLFHLLSGLPPSALSLICPPLNPEVSCNDTHGPLATSSK